MLCNMRFWSLGSCLLLLSQADPLLQAQQLGAVPSARPVPANAAASPSPASEEENAKRELTAGWKTQTQARALTLKIPAPRGQIVDRHGIPFAQTRVAQYLALSFPYLGNNATDQQILQYARERIALANRTLGKNWDLSDDRLLSHYKNRRWLPLVFSLNDGINEELTEEQQGKLKPHLKAGSGLMLQAAYLRFYPQKSCAPHILGYVGKTRALPVTPAQDGDPLFEETEGKSGLEKTFDRDLQGKPGEISILFDADGGKIDERIIRRPEPGNNVVTTLDYHIQTYAEAALARHTKGGAMVIMDVRTGDVLAMASYPLYNPNMWVPGITNENFRALNEDKRKPLYARAFQGEYPPASTFKIIVALAALETDKITPKSAYDCSTALQVGDRVFRNHTKNPEGYMNVVTAIKRSCNTWFYQAGLAVGSEPITDMAKRLGFGERTGIPLLGESAGFVPTNEWMIERLGHKMLGGDIANLSIGQGRTLVTPLQTCQAMAAVADGENMPRARLVSQVQDPNDRVLQHFPPQVARQISLQPEAREAVVKGMVAVCNAPGGTGRAAALDKKYNCQVAGKTGTAQWVPSEERNLAWFTGFLPANNPVYAYAIVYEGQPYESVSGGAKAAPIVKEVFTKIYENAPPDDPLLLAQNDEAAKAIPVSADDEDIEGSGMNAAEVTPINEAAPEEEEQKPRGIGGFFKRLFGGGRNN